jgi:hypothetical protein
MKVKLLKHALIGKEVHNAGSIVDAPDHFVKTWAGMGVYEPAEVEAEKHEKHGKK